MAAGGLGNVVALPGAVARAGAPPVHEPELVGGVPWVVSPAHERIIDLRERELDLAEKRHADGTRQEDRRLVLEAAALGLAGGHLVFKFVRLGFCAVALLVVAVVALGRGGDAPATPATRRAALAQGDSLYPGQALVSGDGQTVLKLQRDGNLVARHRAPGGTWTGTWDVWHGTYRPAIAVVRLQSDCNLVGRAADGTAVWSTGTRRLDGARCGLVVQDNGDAVLYKYGSLPGLWATHRAAA